jgi:polar amino acid transport system substrate-binding protein
MREDDVAANNGIRDARLAGFAPSGTINVALFLPQYTRDASTGAIRGSGTGAAAIEIGQMIADDLGLLAETVGYPTPASVIEAVKSGAADMAFMGIEPSRSAQLDFSPALFGLDYSYLVPPDSSIRTDANADRPGTRIAVVHNHASEIALRKIVTRATMIQTEFPEEAFELLRSGQADAFACPRDVLQDHAATWPGARVLDEAYGSNRVGIVLPQGHKDWIEFLGDFSRDARLALLIQGMIDDGRLRGFRVLAGTHD